VAGRSSWPMKSWPISSERLFDQRIEIMRQMRADGHSIRQIAEAVHVGVGTVHRATEAPVPNGTPEVTGKDGKTLQANALKTIRDGRLYRKTHPTFEEFCQERLGIGRNYVNKIIAFGDVVENLSEDRTLGTICTQISEGATREIASLEPEQQRQVVREASNNGTVKPTARAVAAILQGPDRRRLRGADWNGPPAGEAAKPGECTKSLPVTGNR